MTLIQHALYRLILWRLGSEFDSIDVVGLYTIWTKWRDGRLVKMMFGWD